MLWTITDTQRGITAMKKRDIAVYYLVLLLMIATVAACASTGTYDSADPQDMIQSDIYKSKVTGKEVKQLP
jgi:hypothetical protein